MPSASLYPLSENLLPVSLSAAPHGCISSSGGQYVLRYEQFITN